MKLFLIILLVLLKLTINCLAQSLMCYECDGDNCNQIDTMNKIYCGPLTTTTTEIIDTSDLPKTTTALRSTTTTEKIPVETITPGTDTPTDAWTDAPTDAPTDALTEESTPEPTPGKYLINSVDLSSVVPSDPANFKSFHSHFSRHIRNACELSYSCYTVQYKDKDETKIRKGCVEIPTEKSACDVVSETVANSDTSSCKDCMNNLCNSSSIMNFSTLTMFVVIFIKYLI